MIQYKVHVQIKVYINVPHTVHVLYILSKISKDILRTCLRTFEADIPKIFKNRFSLKQKIRRSYKKKSVFKEIFAIIAFFVLNLKFSTVFEAITSPLSEHGHEPGWRQFVKIQLEKDVTKIKTFS